MADRDNLPRYPSHGNVTRAQRNTAELARVQIRQNERQLRNQVRPAGTQLPLLRKISYLWRLLTQSRLRALARGRKLRISPYMGSSELLARPPQS
ncbi:hypothetical protein GN958_ATG01570 [Phytophthora infestans]|uniref:Uncharacterized protein n=1 Tax=Phytophthora infestans TaxID=4787 RepID=A0A8S9VDK4_PHYIN|nr:hypothetical protein GN958_ATG01570 [Phytophthora infestans]